MFESILESQLNKQLGEYCESLSKDDLNISIWGGDIVLQDITLKKDIFTKLKLPLNLIYGQIGYLRIQIPWRSLSSKPVNVEISDIWLVVQPKTDSTLWQSVETLETSFAKKEELIREMAKALFEEIIKTAEEKKEDASFTEGLTTKIVDNLQIKLRNLHIRVENEDLIEPDNSFSLGLTLQGIDLYTTDDNWDRVYIDRTKAANKRVAMNKLLNIHNFGVYYKTKERNLLSKLNSDFQIKAELIQFSAYDDSGRSIKQAKDYLIIPMRLEVKLIQNDPQSALEARKSLQSLFVGLNEFGITIQKGQYDNMQMLLELRYEYMQFISTDSLRLRKENLSSMNELLTAQGHGLSIEQIKEVYQDIFVRQLDIIVDKQFDDEKKKDQLQAALTEDLIDSESKQLYEAIILGINSSQLDEWARETISEKANFVKREIELKKHQESKRGFFGRMFGGKVEETSAEEKEQLMSQIEAEIREREQAMLSVKGHVQARQNVPDLTFNLNLNQINLTLIKDADSHQGVTLSARDLKVQMNQYDGTNKYQPKVSAIDIDLQSYGLWVVHKNQDGEIDQSPFMQKLLKFNSDKHEEIEDEFFDAFQDEKMRAQEASKPLTHIYFAQGNKEHHDSDLAEKDLTDLEVVLDVQPIEIIYRAETIGEIAKFFKVKKISNKTKLAAQAQYQKLSGQVGKMTASMDLAAIDFKNNKIMISVAAPTLVLPFQQKTWEQIYDSECWVFTMGDVSLISYKGSGFDIAIHEAYQLKVERVKFEHVNRYCMWKEAAASSQLPLAMSKMSSLDQQQVPSTPMLSDPTLSARFAQKRAIFEEAARQKGKPLRLTKILEDFSASVLLLRKRDQSEMSTPQMLQALQANRSPAIQVQAQFDDEMKLSLRPAVFQKLTKIGGLFAQEKKPEDYYKNKMLKKLNKSSQHGQVKMVTKVRVLKGTAAIVLPSKLYFWPENQPQNQQEFDLLGCEAIDGMYTSGLEMVLMNSKKKRCELRFLNEKQTDQWEIAMNQTFEEIESIKEKVLGIQESIQQPPKNEIKSSQQQLFQGFESVVNIPGQTKQPSQSFEEVKAESDEDEEDAAEFGLTFTVPKVSLILKTRKRAISSKIQSDSNEWELQTYLEQISFELQQRKQGLTMRASVSQLTVADNSGDERFPFIFQNLPVEGQQDLMTFILQMVDKDSPEFVDCETFINLGFSGLIAYWKPQTMINLLEFINDTSNQQKQQNSGQASLELEMDLQQIIHDEANDGPNQDKNQQLEIQEKGQKQHKGCMDKTDYQIKVNVSLAYLKAVFIHPDNNTYPIFSATVKQTNVKYMKKCDHDQVNIKVKNVQVFDTTKYPQTLDPAVEYLATDEVHEREILGLNTLQDLRTDNDTMLDMTIYVFEYPSQTRCQLQTLNSESKEEISTDHNLLLKMDLQQMKLILMLEQLLRIIDYSINCIGKLFDKDDANADMQDDDSDEFQPKVEQESPQLLFQSPKEQLPYNFWAKFDLKQDAFCPKLELNLNCPLVILPNLSEPSERFELDFGIITVSSKLQQENNRWINHPDKLFYTMAMKYHNSNLRIDFKKDGSGKAFQPILKEDNISVNVVVPNSSPYFHDKDETPLRIDAQGHTLDMDQVDKSVSVLIKQQFLKLHLKQDVIIELFKMLEHNIMKKDQYSSEFSTALKPRKATIAGHESPKKSPEKFKQNKISSSSSSMKSPSKALVLQEGQQSSSADFDHTQLKKKTVQVSIQSSCLSIELRKTNNDLIAEFCMVNFDYGLQMYADGIMRIYLQAYSLFIFHDEDPVTMTKQVMFGHINASSQMVTTQDFYLTLPQRIRKEKIGGTGADISQSKPKIGFELIINPNTKTSTMKISLCKLKFFLRPQVFDEISEFLIESLKKLDLKKEKEQEAVTIDKQAQSPRLSIENEQMATDAQGSTTFINFSLLGSILVLERREFQKKAAVVQLGVEVKMKSHDVKAIQQQIAAQKLQNPQSIDLQYRSVSDMHIKVLQLTPYVINIQDLETTKFKQAKKRVLISGFDLDLVMKSAMAQAETSLVEPSLNTELISTNQAAGRPKKPILKFKTKSTMEANLSQVQAQVSMDDLYVVQQLANKAAEEALEIGKRWQEYAETSVETESEKQSKSEQDVPTESIIRFKLDQGADIVIINEDKGNFVPLFLFSCEDVTFSQHSGIGQQDKSEGTVDTKCSLYYFNAEKGYWEPAIERFSVAVNLSSKNKVGSQVVKLTDPLNINVSVALGAAANDLLKLLEKSKKRAKVFQKRISKGNASDMQNLVQKSKYQKLLGDQNVMLMDTELAQVDAVTPYAIRNLTCCPINVSTLKVGQENGNVSEISTGGVKGLALSYDDTLNMSEQDEDGRKKVVSKDQFVSVTFQDKHMKPIRKFKLNQNCEYVKHKVFYQLSSSTRLKNQNLNREFYVIQNKLEDQKRVLTIRTQHVLTNRTNTTYKVKLFFVQKVAQPDGKSKKEIMVYSKSELAPQGSIALPDDVDQDIVDILKICLRPVDCKKWSDEFKISRLKNKLHCGQNIVWNHYKSHSILRKEATDHKEVFNYYLLPALIIKNCLPMPLLMTLSHVMSDDQKESTAARRQRISLDDSRISISGVDAQDAGQIDMIGDLAFQRGEERVFDTMSSLGARVEIGLHLNDRSFISKGILLQQADVACDCEQDIVFVDRESRTFKVFARIDTTKAGNKVVIYARNVLLCHTQQPLEFFYQPKTDIFAEDNANEFPLPVRDNRSGPSSSAAMAEDYSEEPTIYIHEDKGTMCAALTGSVAVKSGLVPIDTPGATGQFEVAHGDMLYQYQCSTATYQPSEKESLFTRVVEVSPQYVVCNLSDQVINFCQANVDLTRQSDLCLQLIPKDRQPFHWTQKDLPKTVKFCINGGTRASAPFTIADGGSLAVTNIAVDGTTKQFFRVTKRVVLNSNFIIIEDMTHAPYKIDNLSNQISISYSQKDNNDKQSKNGEDREICGPNQNKPFAWRDVMHSSASMLNVEFLKGNGANKETLKLVKAQANSKSTTTLEHSLDILNRTLKLDLIDGHKRKYKVYVSVYTDAFQKVFEVSDEPSKHIFETEKDKEIQDGNAALEEVKEEETKEDQGEIAIHIKSDDSIVGKLEVEVAQINLSLINKKVEVLTVVLDQLNAVICTKQHEQIFESTLYRLQIDNHGQINPLFPVILKPKCTQQGTEHNHFTRENVQPCFQFYVSLKTNIENVLYINWFEFLLKELELCIEIDHLMSIFEFVQVFNEKFDNGLVSSHQIFSDDKLTTVLASSTRNIAIDDENSIDISAAHRLSTRNRPSTSQSYNFEETKSAIVTDQSILPDDEDDSDMELSDEEGQNNENQLKTWKSTSIQGSADTVYIEKFKGSPLSIDVSIFKQTRIQEEKKNQNQMMIVDLLSQLGLSFTTISGAPMLLNALYIENVYGSQSVVKGLLQDHYMSNISRNVLKLIGSSDLIGNPTDLVDSLGTGAKQFFYEPKEGFMQGPLQGGLGLIKGTTGLVTHTIGGVAGSFSKVTGSLNRGILVLSADDEYRQKKEIRDVQDKPSGFFDGVGKGVAGFGRGLWGGVSGIITKPIEGAKEDGLAGFGKGIGKGLLGTVVKPVSGVVELVSKTTQGIATQVDGGNCTTNYAQMRLARAFYNQAGVFREFSFLNAKLYEALRSTVKEPVQPFANLDDAFYGAFKLGLGTSSEDVLDSSIVLLSSSHVAVLDSALNLFWMLETTEIMLPTKTQPNPIVEDNKMRIMLSDGSDDKELLFNDAQKARAAKVLFEDMFFMLLDFDEDQ